MKQTVQDEIVRRMSLNATLEKAWKAVGTVEGFEGWFTCKVIGDWSPGNVVTLQWPSGNSNEIRIVTIQPITEFAYQWHPGGLAKIDEYPESELTTVTMTLSPTDKGVDLHLVESGFSNISEERRLKTIGMNSQGWDEELENMRKYIEA
jgi:uncharacterized protein YndB with AHSA1/START domain